MDINTFRIITFGCRVNQAESRMLGEEITRTTGITSTTRSTRADIVIINSCCVTAKAEKEVRQVVRRVKKENPQCFLVVIGCWADLQLKPKITDKGAFSARNLTRFSNRARPGVYRLHNLDTATLSAQGGCENTLKFLTLTRPNNNSTQSFCQSTIDLIIPNKDKAKIPEIIKKCICINPMHVHKSYQQYRDKYSNNRIALIKIQDGCNNFCSYCIVPFVRGKSVSRPVEEIIWEVKQKVKEGIKEIVLTGIDISSYKLKTQNSLAAAGQAKLKTSLLKGKNYLVRLIKVILRETKIKKISFGSMNLKVFDQEFIGLYRTNSLRSTDSKFFSSNRVRNGLTYPFGQGRNAVNKKKENFKQSSREFLGRLTTHFHIPLQSGCNKTLKRMSRPYTISHFLSLIAKLKKEISQVSLSTDLIVGFPGETEKEFQQTLQTLKELKKLLAKNFYHVHLFRYSLRPGTLAAKMEGKKGWVVVEEKEKKRRASLIRQIMAK